MGGWGYVGEWVLVGGRVSVLEMVRGEVVWRILGHRGMVRGVAEAPYFDDL